MWSPLLEDYDLKGEKSKPYSVHLSPKITVVPSSFATFKMPARGVPSRQYPLA